MKRLIILSTICMLLFGCSVNEKPQFIGLENIKVLESTPKYVTITADALFINPNDIGGSLKTDEIKVFVNDNEMATVSAENFKIPAKNKFSMPLKTKVPTDSLFSNKNLSGLLGSLFSKKVKAQYKGIIEYSTFGFSYSYNIDKTEDVKINF
ncbi:Late embryogenesis abundant protein [Flaviramulus basaltis]|uniref:Late embryogenesis abundant protein n=1 Tax=Flaviramulus basaltis TaxID=369401 RepID=A0A1K2IIS7_9FLAO|nr:LEA type 2 family protein [Flaviramulus basaltis]SFZ92178.1 Late embryogenesis abundant protein [Flaviramulus basaltis]